MVSYLRRYPLAKRGGVLFFLVTLALLLIPTPPSEAAVVLPVSNDIFLQTTGEQAGLTIGDYFTNVLGDDLHHLAELYIPCLPNETYRIELFDPEILAGGGALVLDEIRGAADVTNFLLRRPDGTAFAPVTTYPSAAATHNVWVNYQTITLPAAPTNGVDCGVFELEVWTGDESGIAGNNNDDNAWRFRIMGGPGALGTETFNSAQGPDGRPGTGDEVWLGLLRITFQHNSPATQRFYWVVDDDGTPFWTGHNFDMDNCATCVVTYDAPTLPDMPGTVSPDSNWNPGQGARLGDIHTTTGVDTEPGLWSVEVTINIANQYLLEIENSSKPIFIEQPLLPALTIAKTDGVTEVTSPGTNNYTITIGNTGPGAALPIAGPEVVDTLPAGMTMTNCTINPPLEGTCTQVGSTIQVNLNPQSAARNLDTSLFGPITAFLPGTASGLITTGTISVETSIAAGLPNGSTLSNTATVDGSDIYGNNIPRASATDVDTVRATPPITGTPIATPAGILRFDPALSKTGVLAPGGLGLPGEQVTWVLTVINIGGATGTNVVISDTLRPELRVDSATTARGTATVSGNTVTFTIPTLAPGESVEMRIVTTVLRSPLAGLFTNTATLNALDSDGQPLTRTASVTLNVATGLPNTGYPR